MRKAARDKSEYDSYFWHPKHNAHIFNPEAMAAYFLFNYIGAQIYRMSKGKICNRGLMGLSKYN